MSRVIFKRCLVALECIPNGSQKKPSSGASKDARGVFIAGTPGGDCQRGWGGKRKIPDKRRAQGQIKEGRGRQVGQEESRQVKYCGNCGADLLGRKFCGECGFPAEGPLPAVTAVPTLSPIHSTGKPEPKKSSFFDGCGTVLLVLLAIFAALAIIGGLMNSSEEKSENALTPEQKKALDVKVCSQFYMRTAFKLYAELSEDDRKMKFWCDYTVMK
jgi:hypothetical protein